MLSFLIRSISTQGLMNFVNCKRVGSMVMGNLLHPLGSIGSLTALIATSLMNCLFHTFIQHQKVGFKQNGHMKLLR